MYKKLYALVSNVDLLEQEKLTYRRVFADLKKIFNFIHVHFFLAKY